MNKSVILIYKNLLEKYGPQGWWPVYSLRNTEGRDGRGYFVSGVPVGTGRDLRLHRRAGRMHSRAIDEVYDQAGLLPTSLSLRESSKFEIAIGAVLTQNTAWINVEKALANLIEQNLIDPKIILDIDQDKLAEFIRPSGYYNQKAKKIKILTKFLLEGNYLAEETIPQRDDLLGLWGIGEETADSILLYAYKVPVFVVDAYTKRIFIRLGLLDGCEKYGEISRFFTDNIVEDSAVYQEYHALIVKHAKESCKINPDCTGCILNNICLKLSI